MAAERLRLTAPAGLPLGLTLPALLLLGLTTWLAAPVLRHYDAALVPWPTHGVALAILLAARPRDRVLLAIGILVAVALGAWLSSGQLFRGIASGALMSAQSIVITQVYDRATKGRHPLRGTIAFAWFIVAAMLGVLPTTLLTAAVRLWIVGPEQLPGFDVITWWLAAVTSMGVLTPILMAPTAPRLADPRNRGLVSAEFSVLALLYAASLLNAFLWIGGEANALPPAVVTIPFLIWGGLRFGVRGYAVIAAMLVTVVLVSVYLNVGPFEVWGPDPIVRGKRAWVYLASLAGPAMIFPVALAERSATELRARASLAQLSAILEGSPDLIAAVDREMVVIAANPAWVDEFAQLSGVRVKPGMPMEQALAALPDDAAESLRWWRQALAGEQFTVTREIGDPGRKREEYEITYGPVHDQHGELVGASQVVRNVTQRRRREAEEQETRRLESIGRLAGGVAHDFNNLMTAVIGYTELVMHSMPETDPRRDDLRQIEKVASRAGELTQQLLAFARRRMIQPRLVNVGELVEGFRGLLAPLLGSRVTLKVHSAAELHPVRLDPTQFEQVLMNLAVNARDAMPGGGTLTIEIANALRGTTPGVELKVRDTGTGMTAEVLERLWEPFFTTKPLGQGTGLGLPTVHGIVYQAGGEIAVDSTLGEGTCFTVFLPSAAPQPAPHTP